MGGSVVDHLFVAVRAGAQGVVIEARIKYRWTEAPTRIAIGEVALAAVERGKVGVDLTGSGEVAGADGVEEASQLGWAAEAGYGPHEVGALEAVASAGRPAGEGASRQQGQLGGGPAALGTDNRVVTGGGRFHS